MSFYRVTSNYVHLLNIIFFSCSHDGHSNLLPSLLSMWLLDQKNCAFTVFLRLQMQETWSKQTYMKGAVSMWILPCLVGTKDGAAARPLNTWDQAQECRWDALCLPISCSVYLLYLSLSICCLSLSFFKLTRWKTKSLIPLSFYGASVSRDWITLSQSQFQNPEAEAWCFSVSQMYCLGPGG